MLNDLAIRRAKPRERFYELTDSRGLALRVHPSGTRVWVLRTVIKGSGERVRIELGEYPGVGLADARTLSDQRRAMAKNGQDPRGERGELTIKEALDGWLKDAGLRSSDQVRRRFELHILPTLGAKLISAVELKDVARLLRDLRHDKGLTAEANRVRSSLSALFAWAMAQGERRDNPVLATERAREPSLEREKAGTIRVLDMAELASIWRAAEGEPSVNASALVRLLILVPLRREEWTQARLEEIERGQDDRWTLRLPAERMKGKRPHAVPLPTAAKAIVEHVVAAQGRYRTSGYIFSRDGKTPYAGWKKAAARLAKAAALTSPWVIHDLRRGAATQMGECGIRENVIRRILAHSPRSMLGVTATYERSERLDEMRDALERWAGVFEAYRTAENSGGENVVAFAQAQRA